jgi:CubicO group peptidase (beta-lactamase class C family)
MTKQLVSGFVAPGFEPVREAFEAHFGQNDGLGSAVAIRVNGVPIVDLWGGVAREDSEEPWVETTPSVVFSVTKGLLALLAARLVQDGTVDYDAPVTDYWPEFGEAGKARTLVRDLLSHRSGLSATRETLHHADILDWSRMISVLEAQEPLWEPGAAHSYHSLTYGWLVGEVIRRVSGQSVGEHFASRLASPLGADAWIGCPEDVLPRVALLRSRPDAAAAADYTAHQSEEQRYWDERSATLGDALPPALVAPDGGFNRDDVRRAEIPGAGGIATARALAAIWSSAVVETDGNDRFLTDPTLDRATQTASDGPMYFGGAAPYPRWGMGFHLTTPGIRPYLGQGCFGHDGAGGQIVFADRASKVGFAYLTNLMREGTDYRGSSLVAALDGCLRNGATA